MSSILIYSHTGLGDHFMCHGIVREYCKKYDKVGIFCIPSYHATVSFMYRDLPNLTVLIANNEEAEEFIRQNEHKSNEEKYDEVKIVGYSNLNKKSNTPLDVQFYQIANVPFSKKWDNFYIQRDKEREEKFFNENITQDNFVLLHDDRSRNFTINRDLINPNYTILSVEKSHTTNIIDYCSAIEQAKEIHVIDSMFMFLVESLQYANPNQKLYIHRYARENHEWLLPVLKKDWIIIIDKDEKKYFIKELLRSILGNKNTLLKKIIRKIFKKLRIDMVRPTSPDLHALVKRYAYEKTFQVLSYNNTDSFVDTAKNAGSLSALQGDLKVANKSDVVLYTNTHIKSNEIPEIINELKSTCTQKLIFHTKNYDPKSTEQLLIDSGFETRERHIFPSEICFVCKVKD